MLISSFTTGVNYAQRGAFLNLSQAIEQAQSAIRSLEDYKKAYPDVFKSGLAQASLMRIQDLQAYLLHYLEVIGSDLLDKQIQQKRKITKIRSFVV